MDDPELNEIKSNMGHALTLTELQLLASQLQHRIEVLQKKSEFNLNLVKGHSEYGSHLFKNHYC